MKKNIRVAVIQAKVPLSIEEGESRIRKLVAEAVSQSVDIVGLPEDCVVPHDVIAAGYDALKFLAKVAKENMVYLFGATAVKEIDGLHDRGFLFDRGGKLIAQHDKIVLTPLEVKASLVAGKTLEVFDTEFGRMAILVCKDSFHRYAPWFIDMLRKDGVDILLIPSYSLNVSERSIALWTDSLKALAKWFDVYIVASGTVGKNITDYPSFGHAMIICPSRGVLAEGSTDKEEVLRANLDIKSLEEIRATFGSTWQPKSVPEVQIISRGSV